ncbi:hypothetical protein [Curtobacterium sp. VKM Ac-2922]|uniref:hypothetical protein n=1 Tax=Curtobacterium sp. VKM Ac-2922 TaxID=2929475 RepID=UPI001FB5284C|nr:hypothetical protein [Curtobacterium sp. VKM Ac-2922]MCJ1714526.1 hypothetical protein [Curtobacterium sp. VKM Ac-2922]
MTTPTRRIAAAAAGAALAGAITLGAALPATAATGSGPSVSTVSATSTKSGSVPTPGVNGIDVVDGVSYLSGTGVPGADLTISGRTLMHGTVGADGTWRIQVEPASGFSMYQAVGSTRSLPMYWATGSPAVPAGQVTPEAPKARTPTPGVNGIQVVDGVSYLSGTGVRGGRVTITGGTTVIATVRDDGTWRIAARPNTGYRIYQKANGSQSRDVIWMTGDPAVPAGEVTPPPAIPAAPTVTESTRLGPNSIHLTGTGTPGLYLDVAFSYGGGIVTKVQADGTWQVDLADSSRGWTIYQVDQGAKSPTVAVAPVAD